MLFNVYDYTICFKSQESADLDNKVGVMVK